MTNEFVTYEQALALKELGFDEPCFGVYSEYDKTRVYDESAIREGLTIPAPLYQQAFRWFREKHGLVGLVTTFNSKNNFRYAVYAEYIGTEEYKAYEEAEQACLDKLIEIAKEK